MRETDEAIYLRYVATENSADLEALLVRHRDGLLLFLLSFVRSAEDAEELLMDTFAKLAVNKLEFDPRHPGSFKSWLYAIGRNNALMHIRQRKMETVSFEDRMLSEADMPDVALLKEERNRKLYQAMAAMLAAVGLQIAVFAGLLVFSIRLIRESGQSITAVFFAFMVALWLLTDLYWVIYDLMRPDRPMPFAANEIGEAAAFLMMAAVLSSVIGHGAHKAGWQGAGAIIFSVCNAALWIAWSGEWIQDMMIGASFTFLLYTLGPEAGGYVIVALLAFALGIVVTLMIQHRKKAGQIKTDKHRDLAGNP